MRYRPLLIVAGAVAALLAVAFSRRVELSRPVESWEPVSLS
ncbi:MAG: hypothetical protein ACT4OP_02910 [Actinomycetota bacterium]